MSKFQARSVLVGNPAKIIKKVSDDMIHWKTEGTKLYQQLPSDMHQHFKETAALTTIPKDRKTSYPEYKTWNDTK